MKKEYIGKPDIRDRRLLALEAADRAEGVLFFFEEKHPNDSRPRQAIAAARSWARGEMKVSEARKMAFAAHAAARSTDHPGACAAARSAGHAAATAHVADHASAAADYALKALIAANPPAAYSVTPESSEASPAAVEGLSARSPRKS